MTRTAAPAIPQPDERGEIRVRLTPRAGANRLALVDGRLRAWVTAPPEDGKANAALIRLLAEALERPPTALAVVRGATARDKVIRVAP